MAHLTAVRLLATLPGVGPPPVQAIGFATPNVGNEALAQLVQERGWDAHITNFLVPGRLLPLLALRLDSRTICQRNAGPPSPPAAIV